MFLYKLPTISFVVLASLSVARAGGPFTYLAPGFNQQLVVTSPYDYQSVAGSTLAVDGFLYTNDGNNVVNSSLIAKWDPSNLVSIHGSTVYANVASITNSFAGTSWGMTSDVKGNLYSLGAGGLYKIDPGTLAGTYVGVAGILGLAYDRYTDSFFSSAVTGGIIETKKDGTFRTIPTFGAFIDQVAIDPTGTYIAAALITDGKVGIYSISTGALSFTFDVGHSPDGLGFDNKGNIFTNNTDGTVTRLNFGSAGYAGGLTDTTLIAAGGFYGDLASVGADGAFYLSQYGTRFDDGTIDPFAGSIVKITPYGFVDGGSGGISAVPEPSTYGCLGVIALGALIALRQRFRASILPTT